MLFLVLQIQRLSEIFELFELFGDGSAEKFDKAFFDRPVSQKAFWSIDLLLFALGKTFQHGVVRAVFYLFAIEADLRFGDGDRGQASAVRQVEIDFVAAQVRLAVLIENEIGRGQAEIFREDPFQKFSAVCLLRRRKTIILTAL